MKPDRHDVCPLLPTCPNHTPPPLAHRFRRGARTVAVRARRSAVARQICDGDFARLSP